MSKEILYIFDISAIVFRYHFASKDSFDIDGNPNGGTTGVILNSIKFCKKSKNIIIWVFDMAKNNFRKKIFPSYKSHRSPVDFVIINQFIKIQTYAKLLDVPHCFHYEYEADDLIASLVKKYKNDYNICIVGNDKDLFQLLEEDNVFMWNFAKKKYIYSIDVVSILGVEPNLVCDFLCLLGDSSDGIDGVPRIGKQTAKKLLDKYGSIENVINNEQHKYDFSTVNRNKKLINLVDNIEIDVVIKPMDLDNILGFVQMQDSLIFDQLKLWNII